MIKEGGTLIRSGKWKPQINTSNLSIIKGNLFLKMFF